MTTTLSQAKIKTEVIEYKQGNTILEGYLAYDEALSNPRPGIVIMHDWMGPWEFYKNKAEELAKQGTVAFVADIYGKGVRPKNPDEAGKLAGMYKSDRKLMRARAQAALDVLRSQMHVNKNKLISIGYCFGGTVALELARSGAPLAGIVTFHGGLATPTPEDAKNIKGKVLVLHGADDPFVPKNEVAAFKDEMQKAHVRMQFIAYEGAVHAFTNPKAGNDNSKGAAYNEKADKASWAAFQKFLKTI